MAEAADNVLQTFQLIVEGSKKYEIVKQGFQNYLIKKWNIICKCKGQKNLSTVLLPTYTA